MRLHIVATGTISLDGCVQSKRPVEFYAEAKLGLIDLSKASFDQTPSLLIRSLSDDSVTIEQDGIVGADVTILVGGNNTFMSHYDIVRGPHTFVHEMAVVVSLQK